MKTSSGILTVQIYVHILSLCIKGAVPICILLHHGQTSEVYEKSFQLAREVTMCSPQILMTDESAAEKDALSKVFPDAKQLLCLFHRLQVCS